MSVGERLTRFIMAEFAEGKVERLGDDENLIDQGLIDSVSILELIAFIEREFSVTLPVDEVVPENFRSIRALSTLIESKQR
jgi:acyl carrier protein